MVQIIGRKSCRASGKARRFFQERSIPFQDFDLKKHPLSEGVLLNISRSVSPDDLVDTQGKAYTKGGYQWMEYDPLEEILEHPDLLKTPVVRYKGKAVCGEDLEGWKQIAEAAKG